MKIRQALQYGMEQLKHNSDSASLDADILLLHSLGHNDKTKIWLNNNLDQELRSGESKTYSELVSKRSQNVPVAYLTKAKSFYGLDFYVDDRVLIPRPETEQMVSLARGILKENPDTSFDILDIGTGSGAIIISLVKTLQQSETVNHGFMASDISPEALMVAKKNAEKHQVDSIIEFEAGDLIKPWADKLKSDRPIIILANLPYLTKEEYDSNKKGGATNRGLMFEPEVALVSDNSGLDHYKQLIKQISKSGFKKTALIIEHHPHQTEGIYQIQQEHLPQAISTTLRDLSDRDRLTIISI